jgi:hypothetical protein
VALRQIIPVVVCWLVFGCTPSAAPQPASNERWETHHIGGDKLGYSVTRWEPIQQDDTELVRWSLDMRQIVLRFGDRVTQQMSCESVETPNGEVMNCCWSMDSGGTRVSAVAERSGDSMTITTRSRGAKRTQQIHWEPSWRGYFAVEQSLRQSPIKPGQRRNMRALVPILNQVAETTLEALRVESTQLRTRVEELTRVECSQVLSDGNVVRSTLWVDAEGAIHKTELRAANQISFATDRETALAEDGETVDLGQQTVVNVNWDDGDLHAKKRVTYRVQLRDGDPTEVFSEGVSQTVRADTERSAHVSVQAVRPDTQVDNARQSKPQDADLSSSELIQADDPKIVALAGTVAETETDAWLIATALESLVHGYVRNRDYTQGLATASDVVQTRQGDCTEYAVLLAALCRSRGIPARVAIGLVYYRPASGFAFHMWNEVWIENRWIPLDATLGMGGTGGGHLKVTESAMDGTSDLASFLPVLSVVNKLQIDVIAVE